MNRPVQRIIIAVLALVLVVPIGVIGLGSVLGPDDEQQQATGNPDASANPDNRPTVDPADQPPRPDLPRPDEPAGLTKQTPEGAEATLTYLLESYSYMMSSGDTSVWEDSVDPACRVCSTFLDNAQLLSDQGGYLVDGDFEVRSTSFEGTGEPPATGEVVADFTQEASILVDDPSLQASQLQPVSGQLVAQIAWDGDRWRVTDMSIAPEGGGAPSDGGSAGGAGGASNSGGASDGGAAG
ncbi:hypothetical protein BH708_10165 [Brachybacterium sp. P6-10-X1]|uniref:DUF6318 family protein n=1 Tax=Brachybacterium sp. P6-10-X1 TaxID=1903186 RepID=UPI000971B1D1|nr:DUF6318 family protein [Brachybacterium sp. P6-10-X1]APX34797.1 hypothetical protein BH708_10165 [Brachybacterium sp. P6-10-X1]